MLKKQESTSNLSQTIKIKLSIYACIGLAIIIALFLTDEFESTAHIPLAEHELNWSELKIIHDQPTGHLYELRNETAGIGVYVATDIPLQEDSYNIGTGWSVIHLSENNVWNPRVCAAMPSIITPTGDVVMLSTERDSETGKILRNIFWFKYNEKITLSADNDDFRYIGNNMFLNTDDMPYYFSQRDGTLRMYALEMTTGNLHEDLLLTMENESKIRIMRDSTNHTPVVGIYNMDTLIDTKYRVIDRKLTIYTDAFEEQVPTSPEKTISNHLNEITSVFIPGSPYETEVLYKGQKVFGFKKEAQVYSFVLGSYIHK